MMNRHSLILASVAAAAAAAAAAAMTSYYNGIVLPFHQQMMRFCCNGDCCRYMQSVPERMQPSSNPLLPPHLPRVAPHPCLPCTKSCTDDVSVWTEVGPAEIRFILFFLRQTGIAPGAKTLTLPLARTRIFCLAAVRNSPRPSIVLRSSVTRLAPSTSRLTTASRLWIHGRCLRYIRASRIVDAGGIRADRWSCTQILAHTIWSNRKLSDCNLIMLA